jgi:plastocyanin
MHLQRLVFRLFIVSSIAAAPAALGVASVSGIVSGSDGKGIAGAVVFVQLPVRPSKTPKPAQVVDQIEKTFVPGLLPIEVGTLVRFPNHDQIHHHVYSFSPAKTFELPLYKGEEAPEVLFDKTGVVKIGCNIHDWMSGVILVLPSSHFVVTDADGRFVLEDLPPATYVLAAWHAQSKVKPEDVAQSVLVAHEPVHVTFTLPLAPAKSRPAMHGARVER